MLYYDSLYSHTIIQFHYFLPTVYCLQFPTANPSSHTYSPFFPPFLSCSRFAYIMPVNGSS